MDIHASELFVGLTPTDCKQILSAAVPKYFASGDVIFWVGYPIREIFLLTEGRVKITQQTELGNEIILRLNVPGQVIGPTGLAPGGNYSSTAQTLQASKVFAWRAAAFEALYKRFPQLHSNAMGILAQQVSEIALRICTVSTEEIPPRLAHGLLYLAGQLGRKRNGVFEIDVTQEILAQMTAMTSCSANRQLSRWEQQGVVNCRRNRIVIRDISCLEHLCNYTKTH
jgi:CRP-like cAMP-binding protein